MTRNYCGWLPAVLALVVAVVACKGEPDPPPRGPATTPLPAATSPATATTPPEATATAYHQARSTANATPTPFATATPSPSPTPIPATATAPPPPSATPTELSLTGFQYDTYDLTGAVATSGSYAFLADAADPSSVVTTYEGLRDGTATALLIHTTDADGVSRAGVYDAVEPGDLFEWRQSNDCWVRYRVTFAPTEATGATRTLGVDWLAYTYTGCRGRIDPDRAYHIGWSPPVIASRAAGSRPVRLITSPTRFGPFLLFRDREDDLEPFVELWPEPPGRASGESADTQPEWPSRDPDEVRRHPLWRDPVLPAGWVLTGHEAHDLGWVSVLAVNETEEYGLEVHIEWSPWGPRRESVPGVNVSEARIIDGHPAVLWYDPTGTLDIPVNLVRIYDEATGVIYAVAGYTGVDIDTLVAVALSFLRGSAE